jgi:ribosomal protein L16 Arg81 hydroxylase
MLSRWLAPMQLDVFLRDYFRKQPYATPFGAQSSSHAFGWDTLERFLVEKFEADILVVSRGKLADAPAPRTLADARALMAEGIGLVIRRAEQHDGELAALASSITRDIPGQVNVQLFVTPAGTHGFTWHYDDEEVFIVQTHGGKEYFLRDNTVERCRPAGAAPDFTRIAGESSPVAGVRLIAGDWLYIPSPWWHMAKCLEDSLSISIGITPAVSQPLESDSR